MARSTFRRLAILPSALLLLVACGNGEEPVEEPVEAPAEAPDEPEGNGNEADAEPAADDDAARAEFYYGGSELFLPEFETDGFTVDYYASFDDVDEIAAWFERNIEDFDTFTVEDETVEGEARWVAHRDAGPDEVARIEIAHSSAHADMGLIAPISDTLPPDAIIIAVAFN